MQKLIELLRLAPELTEDSSEVKNILKMMGDGPASDSHNFDLDESGLENMDAVQIEVSKRIDDLETACDHYHKSFSKMQKECTGIDKKLK